MPTLWFVITGLLCFLCGTLVGAVVVYVRTSCHYIRLLSEEHAAYLRVLASDRRPLHPEEQTHA